MPIAMKSWENGKGSIIKLEPGEELFFSYSQDLPNGPGIVRNGFGSPWMERIGRVGEIMTHPEDQRWLTWFIDEARKEKARDDWFSRRLTEESLKKLKNQIQGISDEISDKLKSLMQEQKFLPESLFLKIVAGIIGDEQLRIHREAILECTEKIEFKEEEKRKRAYTADEWRRQVMQLSSHEQWFHNMYPEYEIVGQQGCGDLTMNEWHVAFVQQRDDFRLTEEALNNLQSEEPFKKHDLVGQLKKSALYGKSFGTGKKLLEIIETQIAQKLSDEEKKYILYHASVQVPKMLHLFPEPFSQRSYSCLIKWKENGKGMTIQENVRFSLYPETSVKIDSTSISDDIELAIFGRQVIRNGAVNDFGYITDQFTDIRHLLQLPNLNPNDCFQFSEESSNIKIQKSYIERKRLFFGDEQQDDIWLGEAQLLADRNLRRAALKNPVYLNLLYEGLAAPQAVVDAAMKRERYRKAEIVRTPGEWRFLPKDYTKPGDWIEVFLKPNKFPCSMIGVSQDGQSVYLLAYAGGYWNSDTGKTIQEVAQDFLTLTNNDVYHALLFDEGGDVFQKAALDGHLTPLVNTSRLQLRCCFIVGKVEVGN